MWLSCKSTLKAKVMLGWRSYEATTLPWSKTFPMKVSTCNLLDFPVREVHCDAPAETEWEKLDWIRKVKIFIYYFWLRKPTEIFFSYILLSTPFHQDLIWWSYEVLGWRCSDCSRTPPPPQSRKLDWICKVKIFIFLLRKSTEKI